MLKKYHKPKIAFHHIHLMTSVAEESPSDIDLPFDPGDSTGESLASERKGGWGCLWDEENTDESQDLW